MKKYLLLLLLFAGISCGRKSADYTDGIIIFDNAIDYPEIDLKLSDVADVTYIPLKGTDEEYFVTRLGNKGHNIFVNGGNIYLKQDYVLYVFDMAGNPVGKLDKHGRGPGEYNGGIASFWVEPETNSVYINDSWKLLEYDMSFNFKREDGFMLTHNIVPLNRDYVVLHNKWQHDPAIEPYYYMAKSDWKLEPCPVGLERPYVHDADGMLEHPSLIYGKDGIFMCNMRSDTVRWMDRSGKITARMVDNTNYGHPDIMAVPSFETDDYLFFSLIFQSLVYKNEEERLFVFDKNKQKIFRIPKSRNRNFALLLDECYLTCRNSTLNENYGVMLFQAINLIDNIDILPAEIKKIVGPMSENDNPLLALIKLR